MSELTYAKINTGEDLLDSINENIHILIMGTGWIGKLTACYVDKYAHKKLEQIDVRGGYQKL